MGMQRLRHTMAANASSITGKHMSKHEQTRRGCGRPRKYSIDISKRICGLLAQGHSLTTICKRDDMPSRAVVMSWLTKQDDPEYQEFQDRYARARAAQADAYFDRIVEIAEASTAQTAHADRVKIDALKWVAARMAPEKYGDRQQVNVKADVAVESRPSDDAPDWVRDRIGAATAATMPSTLRH